MNIRTLLFVSLIPLALLACTPEQFSRPRSAHTMPLGSVFNETIQVGRSTVPLPPGEWTLAAAQDGRSNMIDGSMRTSLIQIQLFKLSQNSVSREIEGFVIVTANADTQSVSWLRDPNCEKTSWLFVKNDWRGDQDQQCIYLQSYSTNWRYGADWSALSKSAVDWLSTQKVALTQSNYLGTYYRYVKYADLLRVWYYVPSRSLGVFVTNDNDWHPVTRKSRPEIEKAFNERVAWSQGFADQVKAGFEGRLTTQIARPVVSSPSSQSQNVAPASSTGPDRATRLRELMDLRQKNLISEDEFQKLRARALEGL